MQYNPRMTETDITDILRQMDETLARLKTTTDDETRVVLLRHMAHSLTKAHSLVRQVA